MQSADRSGLIFDGKIEIPIIDWRHYLDAELDMHNARQSFAARARLLEHDGDASNQLIWFTDARPARVFDPEAGVAGNKPADAVDGCFATNGSLIYQGSDAWNGILDSSPAGPCTQLFPIHGTSRTVAGAPFDEELYKCKLQPIDAAIDRGVYGWWQPNSSETTRLKQIFPTGVCDYSKPDKGRPPGFD